VGRSHHQAYAYLLTPPWRSITTDAQKRLEAFAEIQELGAGFSLAIHDLEIRGAGELLGEEQSGNIQAIGLSLYLELLDRAVNSLRKGQDLETDFLTFQLTEIELQIPALIPANYIDDVHSRLLIYKRMANSKNPQTLDKIHQELLDRFGVLPPETQNLLTITTLKLRAEKLGIRKIEANARGGRIDFHEQPAIDPMIIIQLIQKESATYKLEGPSRLRFSIPSEKPQARLELVDQVLKRLGG
jgi:transcription-repair coupling factor (superfamily II helicase)